MRPVIAVVGGNEASAEVLSRAEELGRALAAEGWAVLTGGLPLADRPDVKHRAAWAAWQAGGRVISLVPGNDWPNVGFPGPRCLAVRVEGDRTVRNYYSARLASAMVALEGSTGTAQEMAWALYHQRPLLALAPFPGKPEPGPDMVAAWPRYGPVAERLYQGWSMQVQPAVSSVLANLGVWSFLSNLPGRRAPSWDPDPALTVRLGQKDWRDFLA